MTHGVLLPILLNGVIADLSCVGQEAPLRIAPPFTIVPDAVRFYYSGPRVFVMQPSQSHLFLAAQGMGYLTMDGDQYAAQYLELHAPAEHSMGSDFPLELQVFHRAPSGQVALSILFQIGQASGVMQQILDALMNNQKQVASLDLSQFVGRPSNYFSYTVECDSVRWIVLSEIKTVNQRQLDFLRRIIPRLADSTRHQKMKLSSTIIQHGMSLMHTNRGSEVRLDFASGPNFAFQQQYNDWLEKFQLYQNQIAAYGWRNPSAGFLSPARAVQPVPMSPVPILPGIPEQTVSVQRAVQPTPVLEAVQALETPPSLQTLVQPALQPAQIQPALMQPTQWQPAQLPQMQPSYAQYASGAGYYPQTSAGSAHVDPLQREESDRQWEERLREQEIQLQEQGALLAAKYRPISTPIEQMGPGLEPGAQVRQGLDSQGRRSPDALVRQVPGPQMRQVPDAQVRQAPDAQLRLVLDARVHQVPGTQIRQVPALPLRSIDAERAQVLDPFAQLVSQPTVEQPSNVHPTTVSSQLPVTKRQSLIAQAASLGSGAPLKQESTIVAQTPPLRELAPLPLFKEPSSLVQEPALVTRAGAEPLPTNGAELLPINASVGNGSAPQRLLQAHRSERRPTHIHATGILPAFDDRPTFIQPMHNAEDAPATIQAGRLGEFADNDDLAQLQNPEATLGAFANLRYDVQPVRKFGLQDHAVSDLRIVQAAEIPQSSPDNEDATKSESPAIDEDSPGTPTSEAHPAEFADNDDLEPILLQQNSKRLRSWKA